MRYVVIGGGIAGVSCANEILRLDRSSHLEVVLISASRVVKSIENFRKVGQCGEKFDVEEKQHSELFCDSRFQFMNEEVTNWDSEKKELVLKSEKRVKYDKLSIATGSRPKLQEEFGSDSRFVFLRDSQSAAQLKKHLDSKRNVLIVGNGGIATELLYELKDTNVTWLVRDAWICASFFPEDVESFIEKRLLAGRPDGKKHDGPLKHLQHSASDNTRSVLCGPALGPDWCSNIEFGDGKIGRTVEILRNCIIEKCVTGDQLSIEYKNTTNGKTAELKPEIVIFACGVVPNSETFTKESGLKTTESGQIRVNDVCETSICDVFSCGDVSFFSFPSPNNLWTQRELWTQARQQGEVCGKSMVAGAEEARMQSMYFELFSHSTTFFGMKVVFLGDYKPERQTAGSWKIVLRNTEEDQLVRCIVVGNVIVGALLIGETDMEETLENLILNKTHLGDIAETFLEPGVDLDDYFD